MKKSYANVLLIDDDKFTNIHNTKLLANHSAFHNVRSVTSGKAALIYLQSVIKNDAIKPDIIFLDINMPLMNGWEFLREYNNLNKDLIKSIELVILTSTDALTVEKTKDLSFVKTIVNKPLSKTALNALINLKQNKISS